MFNNNLQYGDVIQVESDGSINVNVQDQTTRPLDLFMTQDKGSATTGTGTKGQKTLTLASVTNFTDGTYIGVCTGDNFFFATQLGAPSGSVITIDTPLDFDVDDECDITPLTRDMNVDGSSTPQVFSIMSITDEAIDITRVMVNMVCDTAVDLVKFGDLTALTNGIILRKNNAIVETIWNVKKNSDLGLLCYDLTVYAASNPVQGVNGLLARYSFAGQDKHGVAVRLSGDYTLELVIQDDLTDLTEFRILIEGHIVDP